MWQPIWYSYACRIKYGCFILRQLKCTWKYTFCSLNINCPSGVLGRKPLFIRVIIDLLDVVVKFNSNDFTNSAADVLRKFVVVVILPGTSFLYLFRHVFAIVKQTMNSIKFAHFSVLSPFQRFIPISAFYPHFNVLSPFQRFIPISVSAFSFCFCDSVSAFYPYPYVNNNFNLLNIKEISHA